ncbi:BMC domain-containing protein [Paenibacillus taiwanensis]|uniref:BMC domain-containing protein n=1 Tax=Paenibacillus taiwanensis TaxID=401638 RepID=UPI0004225AF4|nr:BMC domain-containing protein [Paenibacillus taiwanensis]
MRNSALGLVEVKGYLGAVAAADAALKAASVTCIGVEVIKGGLVTVKLSGDVGAVQAAVEAGAETAAQLNVLLTRHVIARLHEETAAKMVNPVDCHENQAEVAPVEDVNLGRKAELEVAATSGAADCASAAAGIEAAHPAPLGEAGPSASTLEAATASETANASMLDTHAVNSPEERTDSMPAAQAPAVKAIESINSANSQSMSVSSQSVASSTGSTSSTSSTASVANMSSMKNSNSTRSSNSTNSTSTSSTSSAKNSSSSKSSNGAKSASHAKRTKSNNKVSS